MLRKFILFLVLISFNSKLFSQIDVTISGVIKEKETQLAIPYGNVILKKEKDNAFVTGAATNE